MQTIFGYLKQKPYDFTREHRLFSYAFDWKFAAIFFGIGPASRYAKFATYIFFSIYSVGIIYKL